MKFANASFLILIVTCVAWPQSATIRPDAAPDEDPQLRARAIALLENADRLSSPVWPCNEEFANFKIAHPEPGYPSEGSLRIGVKTPVTKLWEFNYGPYHFLRIQNGAEFYTVNTSEAEPAAVTLVRKLLPATLVHFDHEDVIRKIKSETVDGALAQCIYFDTVYGDRQSSNKICTDAAEGFLIAFQTGEVTIKQSKFFQFNNGWLPGHIERWTGNDKIAEIEWRVEVRTETSFSPDYFEPPPGAVTSHACNSFEMPVPISTPQPEVRHLSDKVVDVVVHGIVDKEGHAANLTVLDDTHSELAAEALRIVAGWTYRPAQCDYKPATSRQDFPVHFKGWE